jgi:hypothetical protein
MIDETGGRWIRCEFDAPAVDPERLSSALRCTHLNAAKRNATSDTAPVT